MSSGNHEYPPKLLSMVMGEGEALSSDPARAKTIDHTLADRAPYIPLPDPDDVPL
jgi:hypothetical protein